MGLDMTTDGSHGDSTKLASASASALATKPAKPARKKFAVPPVKLACLECRASRTRCDGKTECSNCITRGKTCVYTQSKRGGSRIRRKRVSTESQSSPKFNNKELNQCALSIMPESEEGTFAAPLSLVAPGGGLKQLDFSLDDTDFIFDSIFATQQENMDSGYETSEHAGTLSDGGQREVPIRTYSSDEDILSAYYTYIHPYFPVLPPPEPGQVTDNPDLGIRRSPDAIFSSRSCPEFEPCSPLSMAISASLALIPHPDDKDPSGTESLHLRREQAQAFARSAFEGIEIESELIDSTVQPGEALSSDPLTLDRRPFHPRNPVENESIIALIMLSTYEYAQRGNVAKMRNRAGQAVNAAMNLGLHIKGDEEGYYAEANRRVWWMAYIAMQRILLTLALTPPILLYDPRFTTMGPTYSGDPGAWPIFLQSQQAITSATQFVIDLDATLKQGANTAAIWDRMLELEAIIEPLIMAADTWTLSSSPPLALDSSEMVVGQALRGIARIKLNSARIKLHRYCAFSDVPVFSKKHCDLPPTSRPAQDTNLLTPVSNTSTPNSAPNCACSNAFSSSFSPSHSSNHLSTPLSMGSSSNILPYNPTHSARICLKSAFAIARSFASLPYPQPCRPSSNPQTQLSQVPHSQNQHQNQSQELNHGQSQRQNPLSMEYPYFPSMSTTTTTTTTIASPATIAPAHPPRMIPVFACCAMQSSYALIMLSYKTKAMDFASSVSSSPSSFPPSYHHPTNTNTNTHTYTNANFANPNPSTGLARGDGKEPSSSAQRMLAQLGEGLQMILAALRNYSIAYEALGGMRDQIDIAATSVGAIAEQSAASGGMGGGGGW